MNSRGFLGKHVLSYFVLMLDSCPRERDQIDGLEEVVRNCLKGQEMLTSLVLHMPFVICTVQNASCC